MKITNLYNKVLFKSSLTERMEIDGNIKDLIFKVHKEKDLVEK